MVNSPLSLSSHDTLEIEKVRESNRSNDAKGEVDLDHEMEYGDLRDEAMLHISHGENIAKLVAIRGNLLTAKALVINRMSQLAELLRVIQDTTDRYDRKRILNELVAHLRDVGRLNEELARLGSDIHEVKAIAARLKSKLELNALRKEREIRDMTIQERAKMMVEDEELEDSA